MSVAPRRWRARTFAWIALALLACWSRAQAATQAQSSAHAGVSRKTENVFLVLVDGLRWQEVFSGAEEALMNKEQGGVADPVALKRAYWREAASERRAALMPFFWSTIAKEGQLLGNATLGSRVHVSNGHNFSYPGYSEMLVGFADARIDSNDKRPNPNVTVLEWLNAKPAFAGKVAAFAAWDVVPYILNRDRAGFLVNAGFEPLTGVATPKIELLNELKRDLPHHFSGEPDDAITFYTALEYIGAKHPRVVYITFGETDEWAHEGRYDEYLTATERTDRFLRILWESLQAIDAYRGKTTLIVAADHGRGSGPSEWKSHGKDIAGAENIWVAILGPDTEPLGERRDSGEVIQASIASTLTAALGEDYCAVEPRAAKPIARALVTKTP